MATTPTTDRALPLAGEHLYGVPHAEIVVFTKDADGPGASSVFYNSIGVANGLSDEQFDDHFRRLDPGALAREFHGDVVWMNGPRRSLMDTAYAQFLDEGRVTPVGDIPMRTGGRFPVPDLAAFLGPRPTYTEMLVDRHNDWVFDAGTEVHELVAPSGALYVMQSMSRHVDPDLSLEQLPSLGERLQLPEGWQYRVRTLDEELVVRARGDAHIVVDELENNYQNYQRAAVG